MIFTPRLPRLLLSLTLLRGAVLLSSPALALEPFFDKSWKPGEIEKAGG